MSYASIPTEFWDDIFSSVAFLINRLPSSSHQTPFTTLFKKDPDYASLRVLGCLCFPHTRPYNTHKLQLRALPCVFLGYASHQKGYCCLHIPTKKIYISRHVQFVESTFPFSEPSMPNPAPDALSFSSPLLGFIPHESPSAAARTAPAPDAPLASSPLLGFIPHGYPSAVARPAISTSPVQADHTPSLAHPALSISPAQPDHPTVPAQLEFPPSQAPSDLPFTQLSPAGCSVFSHSTHPMVTRTRDHTRKPRTYPNHVAFNVTVETEPSTFSQVDQHPYWQRAMQTEIDALTSNQTWTLVPPYPAQKVIGCK